MKADDQLRRDVEANLHWEPFVDDRRIAVTVLDGIVTLTGEVSSYGEKWKAERAVEQVRGVRGIANELEVRTGDKRSDTDLARAAVEALNRSVMVPADRVKVKVENGWLRLTGATNWDFQRRAAERAVRNLSGVKGISNLIAVRPRVAPKDLQHMIEQTFQRAAAIEADRIKVEVSGSEVTLRGQVRSWAERRAAENAAWAAPGVSAIHDYITVDPLAPASF